MIDGSNEYRVEFTFDDGGPNCCRSFMAIRAYNAREAVRSVQREHLVPITIRGVWILRQRWEALGDLAWSDDTD